MPYADPNLVHVPATGAVAPAAWGTQVRDDLEFLIEPPACSVSNNNVAQSVGNVTLSVLLASAENYDTDAMHSTSVNTGRITIQTPGRYLFTAAVNFATNGTGTRLLEFLHNGTTRYGSGQVTASGAEVIQLAGLRSIVCAAGDFVECRVRHSSGGPLDVTLLEFAGYFFTRS